MTIGERMRMLRKELSLTQSEFGENIGLKQAVIGQMENNTRNITDRTVILICEKYKVCEDWLRNGIGEMFKQDENTVAAQLADEFSLDEVGQAILKSYMKLTDSQKVVIGNYIKAVAKEYEKIEDSQRNEAKTKFRSHTDNIDPDIKKELDSYRQELEMEKSIKASSALPHSNGNAG